MRRNCVAGICYSKDERREYNVPRSPRFRAGVERIKLYNRNTLIRCFSEWLLFRVAFNADINVEELEQIARVILPRGLTAPRRFDIIVIVEARLFSVRRKAGRFN